MAVLGYSALPQPFPCSLRITHGCRESSQRRGAVLAAPRCLGAAAKGRAEGTGTAPAPALLARGRSPGLLQGQAGAGGRQSLGAARGAGRYGTGTAWSTQLMGLRHMPAPQVKTQGTLQLCCSTRSAEAAPDPPASLFSWVLTVEGTGIPCRCHGVKRARAPGPGSLREMLAQNAVAPGILPNPGAVRAPPWSPAEGVR